MVATALKGHEFIAHENSSTTYQYLWDAAKAVLGGKYIATIVNVKKEWSQINKLSFCIKKLEKEQIRIPIKQKEGNNQV